MLAFLLLAFPCFCFSLTRFSLFLLFSYSLFPVFAFLLLAFPCVCFSLTLFSTHQSVTSNRPCRNSVAPLSSYYQRAALPAILSSNLFRIVALQQFSNNFLKPVALVVILEQIRKNRPFFFDFGKKPSMQRQISYQPIASRR